jgi:hypothetical protein
MTSTEITLLLSSNDDEKIKSIYEKVYAKLSELNKRVDSATRNLVVTGLFWLLSTRMSIESFDIGPVSFKDTNVFEALLPIVYCYFLFDIIAASRQKGESFQLAKTIANYLFEGGNYTQPYNQTKHSSFIRTIMPFSYSVDYSRVFTNKLPIPIYLFGFMIALPIPFIVLGLFILPFYMVRYLFAHSNEDQLIHYSSWITLWLVLVAMFYVFASISISMKQIRSGEQNVA